VNRSIRRPAITLATAPFLEELAQRGARFGPLAKADARHRAAGGRMRLNNWSIAGFGSSTASRSIISRPRRRLIE
jgi:hypothetical protein